MSKPKVLLIGWDAADWKLFRPLLENNEVPAVESMINNGVMGNLATLHPVLSPMLWNSIATGKRLFYRQLEMGLEDAYGLASEAMVCNMDSEDAREGIDAFMGKRTPQWRP